MPEPREPRRIRLGINTSPSVDRGYPGPLLPPAWMPSISKSAIIRSALIAATLFGAGVEDTYGTRPSGPKVRITDREVTAPGPYVPPLPFETRTPLTSREQKAIARLEEDLASFLDLSAIGYEQVRGILDREHVAVDDNETVIDFDGVGRVKGRLSSWNPDISRSVFRSRVETTAFIGHDGLLRSVRNHGFLSVAQMLSLRRRIITGDHEWETITKNNLLTMMTKMKEQPDGSRSRVEFVSSGAITKSTRR